MLSNLKYLFIPFIVNFPRGLGHINIGGFNFTAFKVIFLLFIISAFFGPKQKVSNHNKKYLFIYTIYLLLQIFYCYYPYFNTSKLIYLTAYISLTTSIFCIIVFTKVDINKFINWLIISCIILAITLLYEFVTNSFIYNVSFEEYKADHRLRYERNRPHGPYLGSLIPSIVLGYGCFLAIYQNFKYKSKYLYKIIFLFLGLGIYITFSRASFIIVVSLSSIYYIMHSGIKIKHLKNKLFLYYLSLIALGLSFVGVNYYLIKEFLHYGGSFYIKFVSNTTGLFSVLKHKPFGMGFGTYSRADLFPSDFTYYLTKDTITYFDVNLFTMTAIETGILGLFAIILYLLYPLLSILKNPIKDANLQLLTLAMTTFTFAVSISMTGVEQAIWIYLIYTTAIFNQIKRKA